MTKKLLFVMTILLVAGFTLMAADIDGKWTSEQAGRNGGPARVTTYTFKADGAKLTGSLTRPGFQGGDPMTTDISDGTVDGNKVSFSVKMSFGGNDMVQKYTGAVAGDELKLTMTMDGGPNGPMTREITAKKAK